MTTRAPAVLKTKNDPNLWITFGILSLRQNLWMFSFHRIAAIEIKTLSRICITHGAQNEDLFLHILFCAFASPSDLSWARCPFCALMQRIAHILLNVDILWAARSAHIVCFDAHIIMFSNVHISKSFDVHTMCS